MFTVDSPFSVEQIKLLFETKGDKLYGESINQIEHALQCAQLAEDSGAEQSLIIAALLHDVGHLQHKDSISAFQQGIDDAHELIGAKYLESRFGQEVSEPVKLHVDAKRYLCSIDTGYWDLLSTQSKQTLEIQGGPMNESEAQRFAENPYAEAAVCLRKWDDIGKQPNKKTQPLSHFLEITEKYLQVISNNPK
jgi:phosphonate degradation associated HDIG domain protein